LDIKNNTVINTNKQIPIIGIYKIVSPSRKIYIGQSQDIYKRLKKYSFYNCKSQIKLYNSLKKHGFEKHTFEIIEECHVKQLNEKEIYWGLKYEVLGENGLNFKLGGSRGVCGEEIKSKISQSHLGKSKSQQHKDNIKNARIGMKFSQQHKSNMSSSRFRYSVLCVENNKIYKSAAQASKELNLHPTAIIKVCRGEHKQTKGYTFKFN
jgi:group I intron endonuclease